MSKFAPVTSPFAVKVPLPNILTATVGIKSKLVTEDIEGVPAPDPTKFEAVIFPDATILLPVKVPATVNDVKVPTLVMFVCIG